MFLVGESAHTLPPNRGGYGANMGIARPSEAVELPHQRNKLSSLCDPQSSPSPFSPLLLHPCKHSEDRRVQ